MAPLLAKLDDKSFMSYSNNIWLRNNYCIKGGPKNLQSEILFLLYILALWHQHYEISFSSIHNTLVIIWGTDTNIEKHFTK